MVRLADVAPLVRQILDKRGIVGDEAQLAFLNPSYDDTNYDPLLLPGMQLAVERLLEARQRGEQVTVYCDYDVDGTTSAALLLDALSRFGITANYYVPDRFAEGYGLNKTAIKQLKEAGTDLILTADNGIVSFDEVAYAAELGVDVIVTDHHTPRDTVPAAVAVVDPKILLRDYPDSYDEHLMLMPDSTGDRGNELYPFVDLCGCGVAFKLVQALQQALPDDLPLGQEKWLLDLVALATVSDIVGLVDENRAIVRWGLEVIKKTRRPGVKALAAVAGIELKDIDSRAIGFVLGPRLNAAGRLANARLAVELLSTTDNARALELATELDQLNSQRKKLQAEIYEQAVRQVKSTDPVAIAVGDDWHEGVIGIAASKVEEKMERPTFVCSCHDDVIKGSGRSFGDFSIAAVINATSSLLERGGGHAAAGGITVARDKFAAWCQAVQDYYASLKLRPTEQLKYLYPPADVTLSQLDGLTPELVRSLGLLEPFGAANSVPVFLLADIVVAERRLMGVDLQHVRYTFMDNNGNKLQAVAFNAADRFTIEPGEFGELVRANALVELTLNEWNGNVTVQGKLLKLDN